MADVKDILKRKPPDVKQLKRRLRNLFAPGTFFGDIITVREGPESEAGQALGRLAAGYFTRQDLFYPERWGALEEAYRRYRETYGDDAWEHLVASALLLVCRQPRALSLDYQTLRNEVRQEIERSLLDGETLDQYLARWGKRQSLRSGVPKVRAKEAQVWAEVEVALEVQEMLGRLSPQNRQLFLFRAMGYSYEEIAELWGISLAAVKMRWKRLQQEAVIF